MIGRLVVRMLVVSVWSSSRPIVRLKWSAPRPPLTAIAAYCIGRPGYRAVIALIHEAGGAGLPFGGIERDKWPYVRSVT